MKYEADNICPMTIGLWRIFIRYHASSAIENCNGDQCCLEVSERCGSKFGEKKSVISEIGKGKTLNFFFVAVNRLKKQFAERLAVFMICSRSKISSLYSNRYRAVKVSPSGVSQTFFFFHRRSSAATITPPFEIRYRTKRIDSR